MPETNSESAAPMAAAPMKYLPDGSVDWGNMWESFCMLPHVGGPPHRDKTLYGSAEAATAASYQQAEHEIMRGIQAVSGLTAMAGPAGWVSLQCHSVAMARWLAEAITRENVEARHVGDRLLVPVAAHYTLKGEIKSVITVVAKTTDYWFNHMPPDVRRTLELSEGLERLKSRVAGFLKR